MPYSSAEFMRSFLSTDAKFRLADSEWVDCLLADSNEPGQFVHLKPLRTPIFIATQERVSKLTFLLGDLPDLQGELALASSDWSLVINRVTMSTSPDAHQEGNLHKVLTHRGTLERLDGLPFSDAQANRCLVHICRYFSFCYERWVSTANVEGTNPEGKVVYWQLGAGKLDSAESTSNWLDETQGKTALKQFFPGFMHKMADESWEETISTVIYWYIRGDCSKVGPDGSLILLQAALERLAWQSLVRDARILSEDGFNKLPAADTLRLLLSHIQIPLEIPPGQTKLIAIGSGFGWNDGADAVVHTRNRLVHPPKKKADVVKLDYYGAYTIAKWYIELSLLRLGGFQGAYSNRTIAQRWTGQTEPVPWKR
jgi:hypothetical protein